ncbi:hypothetical protein YN1_2650 [Nanoarchaeota archaeon]
MVYNLTNIITNVNLTNTFYSSLTQYGLFDVILPFLLIFSLTFMIIELSGLLKTSNDDAVGRRLSALFSFSFALLAMANKSLISWLYSFIPQASILILAFFLLAIVMGISGKGVPGYIRAILGLIVIGILLWLSINALKIGGNATPATGALSYVLDYLIQSGLLGILIIILILVIVMAWAVGGKQEQNQS